MATQSDALVVMEIVRWRRDTGVDDALDRIFRRDFNRDTASRDDPDVRLVLMFGELVGGLVRFNALDRDLVLGLWPIRAAWNRVGPAVQRFREHLGEPHLYENFDWLASSSGT